MRFAKIGVGVDRNSHARHGTNDLPSVCYTAYVPCLDLLVLKVIVKPTVEKAVQAALVIAQRIPFKKPISLSLSLKTTSFIDRRADNLRKAKYSVSSSSSASLTTTTATSKAALCTALGLVRCIDFMCCCHVVLRHNSIYVEQKTIRSYLNNATTAVCARRCARAAARRFGVDIVIVVIIDDDNDGNCVVNTAVDNNRFDCDDDRCDAVVVAFDVDRRHCALSRVGNARPGSFRCRCNKFSICFSYCLTTFTNSSSYLHTMHDTNSRNGSARSLH
jgi:hypothetical protein